MFSYRVIRDYLNKPEEDVEFMLEQQRESIADLIEHIAKEPSNPQLEWVSNYFCNQTLIRFQNNELKAILDIFPMTKLSVIKLVGTEHQQFILSELDLMLSSFLLGAPWYKPFEVVKDLDKERLLNIMQSQALDMGYRLEY